MSSPVTCSCGPFDCGMQKINVGISVKQIRSRTQRCGFNGGSFAFQILTFPLSEECDCSSVNAQSIYDDIKNTRPQSQTTFNGVTTTTTRTYGDPQILNDNDFPAATYNILSTCAMPTTETTGTPTYQCDENNNGTFLNTDDPIRCMGLNVSAGLFEETIEYGIEECGGGPIGEVSLTTTTQLLGTPIDIKEKSLELIDLLDFPTDYSDGYAKPIARVIFDYVCPTFEFEGDISSCDPTIVKSQEAVVLEEIQRSKTIYAINFKLPETCYVKIWYAKWSTKEKASFLGIQPDEFWYGNVELISEFSIESRVADLPEVNGTCISEDSSPEFISIISEQDGLSGELSTLDFEDLGPNEDCCTSETPDDGNYCRYSLTKRIGVIGWSIIDGYEPQFYDVEYDPETDPDPLDDPLLGNYYANRISSSRVIFSPFNDYSPLQSEQTAFDQALAGYYASQTSQAP